MKMVSGLHASRVESLRQGWREGRPNAGAGSLMSSWTWIPAGTKDCRHLLAGRRARTVDSFYRGIPPAPYHGRCAMDVMFTHCAGLDVHKKTVRACRVTPDPTGE